MNGFSIEVRTGWMDDMEGRDHFGALFSADPFGVSSPTSVEVGGETYARQDASGLFTRSSPTSITLGTALLWRALQPGTMIAAVGFFDTAFGTTGLLHRALLDEPISYPSGGSWVLPVGEYVAGLDL